MGGKVSRVVTLKRARAADKDDARMTLTVTLGEFTLSNLPLARGRVANPPASERRSKTKDKDRPKKGNVIHKKHEPRATLADCIQNAIKHGIYRSKAIVPGRGGDERDQKDETWVYEWSVVRLDRSQQ